MRPSVKTLRRLYTEEGRSLRAIGERCGVSASTVLRWLNEAGVERREPGRVSEQPDAEELLDLYVHQGLSVRELADAYDKSEATIRKWLRACDLGPGATLARRTATPWTRAASTASLLRTVTVPRGRKE